MRNMMNLRLGKRRALREIEQDLADSDPHLDMLYWSFTRQAHGQKMPRTERIRRRPLRLVPWPRRRPGRHWAGEAWPAWPRPIP